MKLVPIYGTGGSVGMTSHKGIKPVFFHIVGEILDRVTQGNRVQSAATETWLLGGSQNMIVDLVFDEPGVYALVNHDYAAIYTGGLGLFVAGDPFGLNPRLVDAGILTEPVPSYAYASEGILTFPRESWSNLYFKLFYPKYSHYSLFFSIIHKFIQCRKCQLL